MEWARARLIAIRVGRRDWLQDVEGVDSGLTISFQRFWGLHSKLGVFQGDRGSVEGVLHWRAQEGS